MKQRLLKFLMMSICVLIASCTSDLSMTESDSRHSNYSENDKHVQGYSKSELVSMASKFFSKISTRTIENEFPVIEPLVSTMGTRSGENSDTVAYVLNYPISKRFIVLANDKNVSPVLAYSDENVFDKDDTIIQKLFISNIPKYIAESPQVNIGDTAVTVIKPPTKEVIGPHTSVSMYGESPFNKYLCEWEQSDQMIASGFLLSTAFAMITCKPSVTFHDVNYNCNLICKGLQSAQGSQQWKSSADKVAKIILDIDKDLQFSTYHKNPDYVVNSLEASMHILYDLDYNVDKLKFLEFEWYVLIDVLRRKNILVVSANEGYFYNIDGAALTLVSPPIGSGNEDVYYDWFYHCKWGMKNVNDGYYRGGNINQSNAVFSPGQCYRVGVLDE